MNKKTGHCSVKHASIGKKSINQKFTRLVRKETIFIAGRWDGCKIIWIDSNSESRVTRWLITRVPVKK